MENGSTIKNIVTHNEISNMTSKEGEYFENKLAQLKNQVDEMSFIMLKWVDLTHSREYLKIKLEDQMKKKMDENKNGIKEELQKSIKSIEAMFLQRIPKRDMEIQGNHGNEENNGVDT